MPQLSRKLAAEATGTFFLVFFGCGAIRVGAAGFYLDPAFVPIIFGLVVAAMIYATGHISGAHFNPAVTLAFAVTRHFPPREILPYWVAQFGAAVLATWMLEVLLPGEKAFGATIPKIPLIAAVGWEFLLSFALMFVVMGVATDTRALGIMAGAAIGATVALAAFVGGPLTGASMNPARSLGPMLFEHQGGLFWIYLIGPILGTLFAALLYRWIRNCPESDRASVSGCC